MSAQEPIAFRAALPVSGTQFRVAGGEGFLTVAVPESDVQVLYDNMARLRDVVFFVTLIPEGDLAVPIGKDRKRGRRRSRVERE